MTPSLARLLPPRRGAVARPVAMEVVRALTEDDLRRLPYSMPIRPGLIRKAREIHHRCAQLVADGRRDIETAAIVGYTPQRVRDLKKDPTFQYLVKHYSTQVEEIHYETHRRVQGKLVDVLELATDEIQSRLENDDTRSILPMSELRKVAEFAADRTVAPPRATTGGPALPPTRIELNFGWNPKPKPEETPLTTIDVTPTQEE